MSQETFWVLISKKLSGEASIEELTRLEALVLANPQWQYAIQNLEDLWKHQPSADYMQEEDAYLLHIHRLREMNIPFGDDSNIPTIRKSGLRKWYWAAAAVLVIAIGLFVFNKRSDNNSDNNALATQENEISTRRGSRTRVQLPDGSVVMLNAGSKLTYDKNFGIGSREVTLTGEGFFDVKKQQQLPFIIHTSSINIKVLGTVFNVRAYPEDKKTETSLIRGSIEVTIKNRPNDKIILSPSEKLVVENTTFENADGTTKSKGIPMSTLMAINKLKYNPEDSAVAETQWIDNKLVFDDESFGDLAMRMERWYDVDIAVTEQVLMQRRMTGSFEKETIEQALEALKISIPFQYEKTGNKISIHR